MARERERPSFNYFKKWLRKHFPSQYSVRILLVHPSKLPGNEAFTYTITDKEDFRFLIHIANNLNINQTIEALLHEWCHILCGHTNNDIWERPHQDVFWAFYGKIYRKWHDED